MEAKVNSIPTLIKLAREEQANLKQLADKISVQQELLSKVIESLESPVFHDSVKLPVKSNFHNKAITEKNPQLSIKEQYYNYPRRSSRQEKIRYILRKEGVAMKSSEIQDMIIKVEGATKSRETLKNFYNLLVSMATNNELLTGRVTNRRYTFYILPEFLDNNYKLKQEHYPREESWGTLEMEKRKMIADCFRS